MNGNSSTCIQSPLANSGLSSYFALDVTDPAAPKYLWEFAGSVDADGNLAGDLGAATTGPVVIREAYRDANGNVDNSRNGTWYAVFASGPTGPIDTVNHRFLGQSDQSLKVFLVDLATGTLVHTFDSGVPAAFAGSLAGSSIDSDRMDGARDGFYSDDAVYLGYTQLDGAKGTWTSGGVLRLTTANQKYDPLASAPGKKWALSPLISGTGPVTTAIAKLQDTVNHNLWIYFGTGRFFFNGDDSSTALQKLYGIKDPCYAGPSGTIDPACTAQVTGALADQSGSLSSSPALTLAPELPGWSIILDPSNSSSLSERVVSDPTASPSGAVFFTSFKPNLNPCQYGGSSYVWAVRYDTGGVPPSQAMKGQGLLQASTGALTQIALASAFRNPGNKRLDGRRIATAVTGMPPLSQGVTLIGNPRPARRIVHIREK